MIAILFFLFKNKKLKSFSCILDGLNEQLLKHCLETLHVNKHPELNERTPSRKFQTHHVALDRLFKLKQRSERENIAVELSFMYFVKFTAYDPWPYSNSVRSR